jgi:DNA polymerase-3 subunit beta
LQLVGGVVVSKPVIPILETFLFDIKGGLLTISATDLETSMTTSIKVDADKDVTIAVPSRLCIEILRSLPDQPVTFSIETDTNSIEIHSGNGRFKLTGQPGADFPKLPDVESEKSFSIKSSTLLDAITKTVFSTGNDELRLNLTGIFIELKEDNISFVATDANRLVRYRRNDIQPGVEHSFILPKKAANLLKSSLPDNETTVKIDFNSSNAFFGFGDTALICRFIDERYPDYNAVIPKENPNSLLISRTEFLNSVKRISIVANKTTHQIRLKIAGSELTISAEDFDMSNEGIEKLKCEYTGEDMEIGFNSRFLLDMLTALNTEFIRLEMSTPNRAGVLLPSENEDGEDMLMLVMPMMLNNY